MELQKYIAVLNKLKTLNENAQERWLVAYFNNYKTLDEVDTLPQNEFNKLLNNAIEQLNFEDVYPTNFKHNNVEYKTSKVSDITAIEWVNLESTLDANIENVVSTYYSIICIATKTTETNLFYDLDHKIAMPIVNFFLNLLKQFDQNILKSIKLLRILQDQQHPDIVKLKTDLIDYITLCVNSYSSQPTTTSVKLI